MINSTGYYCRRPRLGSQHAQGGSQPSVTTVSGGGGSDAFVNENKNECSQNGLNEISRRKKEDEL